MKNSEYTSNDADKGAQGGSDFFLDIDLKKLW